MQIQGEIEGSGSSPSFNCYSSDSITSTTIAKVIREQHQLHVSDDVEVEDFAFKFVLNDDESSSKQIDSQNWTVFHVFNREVEREIKSKHHENDILEKLFIDQPEESSSESDSSSETDESEQLPSGTFCVWQPKWKKSRSTGSGSKRWMIRYLLRRSNSDGNDPVLLLSRTKVDGPKQKRTSGEVSSNVSGRLKARTPVHEQFYVRRRAEKEVDKKKSFLPYRKDLVGLFSNVNGMGKMLPF